MKKSLALILVFLLTLSMFGCSSSTSDPNPGVTETEPSKIDYPTKDLDIVIPYKVGGTTDLSVRGVLDAIPTSVMDKNITVENIVGGSGLIGTEAFLSREADGYTLGLVNCDLVLNYVNGTTTINPMEQFTLLAAVEQDPYLLLAGKNDKFSTFAEFIAYAEQNPGELVIGVTGVGTIPNLLSTIMKSAALDVKSIPYDSATDAIAAVIAGESDICISAMAPAVGNIQSDDLIPIAVTSSYRSTASPDVPTMAEVDERFADVNLLSWIMVAVHAGVDEEIVSFLQDALSEAVASEQYAKTRSTFYFEPITIGTDDLANFIVDQGEYYKTLIQ